MKYRRIVGDDAGGKPDMVMAAPWDKGTLAVRFRVMVRDTPAKALCTEIG